MNTHDFQATVTWTGNLGSGTASYSSFSRAHEISAAGKAAIAGSSAPAFRGDASRWNPEELLVASLSACHQLWYLHLCAVEHVIVLSYVDGAQGTMDVRQDGGGRFTSVTLRPVVTISRGSDPQRAQALHENAHAKCFIANSVNFSVRCEGSVVVDPGSQP
ncbi:MAG: OsmC family protein [Candidatus Velthaea sp.]